jgi:hypothetical protein
MMMRCTVFCRAIAVLLCAAVIWWAAGLRTRFAAAQDGSVQTYNETKERLQDKKQTTREAAIAEAAKLDKNSGCALLQDHLMKEPNLDLISRTISALEQIGSDQAVGVLSQIALAVKSEKLGPFLTDGVNPYLSLQSALGRMAPPHLLRFRIEAIGSLSRIGSKKAMETLAALLQESDAQIACAGLKALYDSKMPLGKEKFLAIFNARVTDKSFCMTPLDTRKRIAESVGDRIGLLKLTAVRLLAQNADGSASKQVLALIPEYLARLNAPVKATAAQTKDKKYVTVKNALGVIDPEVSRAADDYPRFADAPPPGWQLSTEVLLAAMDVLVRTNCKETEVLGLLDRIATAKDAPASSKACKECIAKIRKAAVDAVQALK